MPQAWDREPATAFRRYFKTDWSAEERAFVANVTQYKEAIAPANPIIFSNDELLAAEQALANKEVAPAPKKIEEIQPKKQEVALAAVESENVGTPVDGLTTLRTLAKETRLPTSNDFDELFGSSPSPAPTTKTKTPAPPLKPIQPSAPECPSKPAEACPMVDAPQMAEPPKKEPPKAKEVKAEEAEGLDDLWVRKVRGNFIDKLMEQVSQDELDIIQKALPGYAVELKLEYYREVPRSLDEKIAEVSSKKDGIQAVRRKLAPIHDKVKAAWEYLLKVGSNNSRASNQDKRIGFLMSAFDDVYWRMNKIKSLLDQCDSEYEHLKAQHDTVSRLATFYCSITRGELPSTMPLPTPPAQGAQVLTNASGLKPSDFPSAPVPTPTAPPPPVNPEKMRGLDPFPTNAKEIARKGPKPQSGITEF